MAEATLAMELRVSGLEEETLRVASFEGEERLSDLYSFWIDVVTDDTSVDVEDRSLGRDAALTLRVKDRERTIHGVIARAELVGFRAGAHGGQRHAQFRLELVPRAHLLTLRRTSRVFQDQRFDEIVREVLLPYFIPVRFALREDLPRRRYTTQLEETDFAFLQRLVAESGYFFFFEQPGVEGAAFDALRELLSSLGPLASAVGSPEPREVLVIADEAAAYPPMRADVDGDLADQALGQLGRAASQLGSSALPAGADRIVGGVREIASAIPGLPGMDGPVLSMRAPDSVLTPGDEMVVHEVVRRRSLRPTSVVYGDYDPLRPHPVLRHTASHTEQGDPWSQAAAVARRALGGDVDGALGQAADGALAAGIGAAADLVGDALPPEVRRLRQMALQQRPLELFMHHNRALFPDAARDAGEASRILRATRREADVVTARGICPWVSPGHWFVLGDHEVDRLNRSWVPITVKHHATGDAGSAHHRYRNEMTCVPADVAYPARAAAPRKIHVCYTATVTGGAPVHTEEGGMVEVRFHWDRENEVNVRRSTCWLRLMQPWAGAGWGTQFIPRVGTEVVVSFEGGNPDKPFVLGGVHNATNPPPFPLPAERTKSGIKTRSLGGDGSNELSFDDARGAERVYLHAERNYEVDVENDRVTNVRHEDRLHVEADRTVRVAGVTREEYVGRREVVARGGEGTTVHGGREVTTEGDETTRVAGAQRSQVDGRAEHTHRGRLTLTAQDDVVQRIGGNFVRLVGSEDGKRSHTTRVEGDLRFASSEVLELSSTQEILLRCGDSVLRLSPDAITLQSSSIALDAGDVVTRLGSSAFQVFCDGGKAQVVADQVLLKATGAAVGLSSEAAIQGSRVLLNSPASASDAVEPSSSERTVVVLNDEEGNPIPDQAFRVVLDGGREVSGATDAQGRAVIDVEDQGTIEFVGLRGVRAG